MNLNADDIIKALDGNEHTGMCLCPAHEDHEPSLKVETSESGNVLVHCYAGCTQEEVIAALRARSLWPTSREDQQEERVIRKRVRRWQRDEDEEAFESFRKAMSILGTARGRGADWYLAGRSITLVPPNAKILETKKALWLTGRRLPAMVFPIINERGMIQGAHVTYLTRDLAQNAQGKDGKNMRRMFGAAKGGFVAFGSANTQEPLIVGEGVESVLSAMQIAKISSGIAALSATNLKTIRPPRRSEVIIATDNDAAGIKAAEALAGRLEFEGQTVRIAKPISAGKDWNDVLRADSERAREEWDQALANPAISVPLLFHPLEDFMNLTFPKREMLLAPWLPQPGIAMIYARAGHGKTYLALSIAFAVARGEGLLGWPCERPGRVLYIDGEMPGSYLQERLRQYGHPPRDTLHIVCRDTFNLHKQAMPDLGTAEGRRVIDAIIGQVTPDLVILDSLSTLVRTGEENSPEHWMPVQNWLMSHRWRGRSMLIIHHAGKSGAQRGTSKREDTPETTLQLVKRQRGEGDNGDESVFEMTFTKGREVFGGQEEPLVLRLAIREGRVHWSHETMRDEKKERVREMLKLGLKHAEIAQELGISRSRVTQISSEIRNGGQVLPFLRRDR